MLIPLRNILLIIHFSLFQIIYTLISHVNPKDFTGKPKHILKKLFKIR